MRTSELSTPITLSRSRTDSHSSPYTVRLYPRHPVTLLRGSVQCGQNLEALKVAVVSFDGQVAPYIGVQPLVGPEVIRAAEMELKNPSHLGYMIQSPAEYKNDPMAVGQAVYDEHIWAALIVNANATAILRRAVETGDHSYDLMGAAQFIYNEARDKTTYDNYIVPIITLLQTQTTSQFGEMWASQVLSNTSLSGVTLARAPQAVSPAIGFST